MNSLTCYFHWRVYLYFARGATLHLIDAALVRVDVQNMPNFATDLPLQFASDNLKQNIALAHFAVQVNWKNFYVISNEAKELVWDDAIVRMNSENLKLHIQQCKEEGELNMLPCLLSTQPSFFEKRGTTFCT